MSRLQSCFSRLKAQKRSALISYITAGDPDLDTTLDIMRALVRGGCDVIELGVPFSDPMADGPVIQRAVERALDKGTSLRLVLEMVRRYRTEDQTTPLVLMGYLNPIEALGYETFAKAAAEAGLDGALTVDIPPEESAEFLPALHSQGLDPIYLLAPTSDEARIKAICNVASGFVYYVSLKGVTGSAQLDFESIRQQLERIRAHTDLPLGVGFGVSSAETAAALAPMADAVILGSALVSRIERLGSQPAELAQELEGFIGSLRQAMDVATQAITGESA
jgi:tryptophan synthase alpha chain